MFLLFNVLSSLIIAFLPRSKHFFNFMAQSPSAVILKPIPHCFHSFPIYLPWTDGTGCRDLSFLNVEFKANFFTLSLSSRGSLVLLLSAVRVVSSAYLRLLINLNRHLLTQFNSVTQSCPTLCNPMNHSMPGLPVHHQLPESTQTHVHWVSDAIQPSHPLVSPSPPALNLSSIRIFSNESALRIRWQKYWSFSFNISPSNEHPELISFIFSK